MKTLYNQGYDFDKFMHLNDGEYVDKVEAFLQLSSDALTDELKSALNKIKKAQVLVFGEVWCPDCVINIAALEILAQTNSNIEYKILPREGNEEILGTLTPDGSARIPTFISVDDDYQAKGFFLEKPKAVKAVESGDDQVKRIVVKRDYRNGKYLLDTLEELIEIL